MAATIEEKFGSPEITKGDEVNTTGCATRTWVLTSDPEGDALTEETALALLESTQPATYQGMYLRNFGVKPISNTIWIGTSEYGDDAIDTETPTTEFDTTGGSQHITQSLHTDGAYAPGGSLAPYFGGAIGVSGNEVQGVDIVVPVFKFSEEHFIHNANQNALLYRNLTGCYNISSFRGFAAGEVLFLGARGIRPSQRSTKWSVTFQFAAGQNKLGFYVGDIYIPKKIAWDYMWVLYEDIEDENAATIVKQPKAVYCEEVYPAADFSLLGI